MEENERIAEVHADEHITEGNVPETPRLTADNVERPLNPDKVSEDEKKNQPDTANESGKEKEKHTETEGTREEEAPKKPFDKFNEIPEDKFLYIIDKRLFDNGYQLSSFVTYIKMNANPILAPDKILYAIRMDNCITSSRYKALNTKEGWKEALSFTGLSLETMLNSGDYVFILEEEYDKKVKELVDKNKERLSVNRRDINYSTYELRNRRTL